MPVRIKPVYDLGPCRLFLDGIKGISDRVERDFPNVRYGALDGAWEIYDEPRQTFLDAISQRERLDEITIIAEKEQPSPISLKIILGKKEANVYLVAAPELQDWFEHFLIDLKKHLEKPDFAQLLAYTTSARNKGIGWFSAMVVVATVPGSFNTTLKFSSAYCKIIIHRRPPNEFVENIKVNLVSNLIWAILVFIAGVIVTLLSTGQIRIPFW